jgi:DNA-binding MarR family transcriptional regulator
MTKGAVTKIIDRLVAKRLVARALDPEDGRVQRVALTRAGRALVPALAALADENETHFLGHLSVKDRRALIDLLREIVDRHGLTRIPTD